MSDNPHLIFVTTAQLSMPMPQPCVACGTDCRIDLYIVRGEVWAEAGMDGWDAGFLCTRHIQKRLGRRMGTGKDLLRGGRLSCDPVSDRVKPQRASPETSSDRVSSCRR